MGRCAPEIPIEIVNWIFASFATKLSTGNIKQFPWFLGHICSTWRSLFLSMTPEFWDSISIIVYPHRYESVRDVTRFFLDRDPAAPFSFDIMAATTNGVLSQTSVYIPWILEMLVDESLRWKSVKLQIFKGELVPLSRAKNRLPLLQQLELRLWGEYVEPDLDDVFQSAPSLEVVTIDNLDEWKFNLSNLRVLNMHMLRFDSSDFLVALSQMTKLERAKLRCTFERDVPSNDTPSNDILLPNLTVLECDPDWLLVLKTPELEDLNIIYLLNQPSSSDGAVSLLRRSDCGSKVLRLRIYCSQAATAIEIIRHTPQIVWLELFSIGALDDVLTSLTISENPERTRLAPHLVSLNIHGIRARVGVLYDLVSSRTAGSAAENCGHEMLQKLHVYGFYSLLDCKKRLIALCKERRVRYTVGPT